MAGSAHNATADTTARLTTAGRVNFDIALPGVE
jgi:hypothetical protein